MCLACCVLSLRNISAQNHFFALYWAILGAVLWYRACWEFVDGNDYGKDSGDDYHDDDGYDDYDDDDDDDGMKRHMKRYMKQQKFHGIYAAAVSGSIQSGTVDALQRHEEMLRFVNDARALLPVVAVPFPVAAPDVQWTDKTCISPELLVESS